jgi:hypothetical protein
VSASPVALPLTRHNKICKIIITGEHLDRRALFESLIEHIEIDSDEALTPSFRVPIMRNEEGLVLDGPAHHQSRTDAVRALPPRVGRQGLEP